ncbi:hypothetical protein GGD81_002581 [Rhodobium orientis]|uniref:hypothetical protein n=1 Tax=Rhodobium orientis TaxID=34017 RepID=UPI0011B94A35|nr:hypothetical protein [Rhodobium orientis]MBB4303538.1 hypothetical protein [Rhodobium orientis]MBK5950467.1 hypothetical protein [Rhodobium orientis]
MTLISAISGKPAIAVTSTAVLTGRRKVARLRFSRLNGPVQHRPPGMGDRGNQHDPDRKKQEHDKAKDGAAHPHAASHETLLRACAAIERAVKERRASKHA